MYIKSMGLFCLLVSNLVLASDLYKTQFVVSNKTHGLNIKFPPPNRDAGMPAGPTDATVIDNKFVVLDTYGSGVSFFDPKGVLLKRVSLPKNIQFQNIVRDRDNSIFVFGADPEQTMVVHIQNYEVTEQATYKTSNNYIDTIIPDDYGLVMNRIEDHFDKQKYVEASPEDSDKVLEGFNVVIQDRINRNCMSCEPKSVDGIQIGGLLYRITPEKKSSLFIGKKEVPLMFYSKHMWNINKVIQVDQDGTAWVENTIDLVDGGPLVTYVWKVNKSGDVASIYRFASDEENSSIEWLMKRDIIISNDGTVYGLVSNKKQFKLIRLKPFSLKEMKNQAKKLDLALLKKKESKIKNTGGVTTNLHFVDASIVGCRTRQKVITDAVAYTENPIHLSDSSIKNDTTCPKRMIPPYLTTAQTYNSVSYNWGGFDTITEFNKKILTNKMKAGNVNSNNSPLLSCAAGVDCSGLVSRAWGLTTKLGTHDIADSKFTDEIGWIGLKAADVFIIPGNHVYVFQTKADIFGDIVWVVDSNAEYGAVVRHKVSISLLRKQGFKPRRPKSNLVCTK